MWIAHRATYEEHFYNGDGQRVRTRHKNGDITRYVWSGDEVVTTYDASWQPRQKFWLAGSQRLGMFQGSNLWNYGADRLGNVFFTIKDDTQDQVQVLQSFSDFGEPLDRLVLPETATPPDNPLGFTGQWHEPDSELVYLRARFYSPMEGRFFARDPWPGDMMRPQTLNPYAYCTNNPVNRIDPSGLDDTREAIEDNFNLRRQLGLDPRTDPENRRRAAELQAEYDEKVRRTVEPAARIGGGMLPGVAGVVYGVGEAALDHLPKVQWPKDKYPEARRTAEQHLERTGGGTEIELEWDSNRDRARARRAESTRGVPKQPGMDVDEFPPATTRQGGHGATTRHVPSSQNRGAGSWLQHRVKQATDGLKRGARFILQLVD